MTSPAEGNNSDSVGPGSSHPRADDAEMTRHLEVEVVVTGTRVVETNGAATTVTLYGRRTACGEVVDLHQATTHKQLVTCRYCAVVAAQRTPVGEP